MTRYTHPDLDGFMSPAAFVLGDVKYPRVWWRTVDAQEITDLGFVEYVPPEPDQEDITNSNIMTAPKKGFGGPTGKGIFNGNR